MNNNKYDESELIVKREPQDIISYFERFMGNGEQDQLREQVEKISPILSEDIAIIALMRYNTIQNY